MKEKKPVKQTFTPKTSRLLILVLWLGALSPILALFLLFITQPEDELPSVEMLENPPELLASVVLADDGKTELGRYWSVNRTNVEYKDISPYVFDALIATEDERYLDHAGVDLKAVGRAITKMGAAGGASTISQQLAKLLFTLQERARKAELKAKGETEPAPSGRLGRIQKRLDEKVKENIIAVRLESRYTKEEIITMYLNQFDFLYNAVGIENAAKVYFNKKPIDLTKSEAAMLVGMCKNPGLYNPYTYQIKDYRAKAAKRHGIQKDQVTAEQMQEFRAKDSIRALSRRNQVLFQWKRNTIKENVALKNHMPQAEYDSLIKTPIVTDYQVVDHKEGLAPYFRESLRSQLSELFKSTDENGELIYQNEDGEAYNVYKDGLKIYTTINVRMQQHAENAMKRHLSEDLQPEFDKNNRNLRNFPFTNRISDEVAETLMNSGRKNSERYRVMKARGVSTAEIEKSFELEVPMRIFSWGGDIDTVMTPNDSIRYYKGVLRAGLVSMEPSTGFVKAWVGGADFNHFAYDHVKQGTRQVGSTIKPFVYATAITMGVVKPCTKFPFGSSACVDVFENEKITKQWCPKGALTPKSGIDPSVAWCLANSNNPGTVLVMSKMGGQAGPKNISKLLKDLDINLRPEDEVPSMCLGVMDLSLYQMVGAQSMFVNQGIYVRPSTILRIEDRNGNVIYGADPYSKEVLNSGDAHATLQMMRGCVQFGTGASLRGGRKWGGISQPTAGKTGTTQNNSDGWFMGLTPDLVTGVWVGAEDRAVRFRSMTWGQGARMALPIYGYYMQKVYKDPKLKISTEEFEAPIGYDPSRYECDGSENIPNGEIPQF
ncbi:MAG: transglycosylase domain-containing protein [Crocinitomicaceae bacterium]|nr:transglycosylase domain-containing protein [Crocinitomicaceae bacterium]